MLEKVTSGANEFADKLPKILTQIGAALLVAAVGYVLLRLGRLLLKRIFKRYGEKHGTNTRGNTVQTLSMSLFNVVMYFAIVLTALSTLGVDVASLIALASFPAFSISRATVRSSMRRPASAASSRAAPRLPRSC